MIRMPPCHFDHVQPVRRTCPELGKTQAELANPIECYRTPLWKRALWAFCKHGWLAIVPGLIAAILWELMQ